MRDPDIHDRLTGARYALAMHQLLTQTAEMPRATKLQSLNRLVQDMGEQPLPKGETVGSSFFADAGFARSKITGAGRHVGVRRQGYFALNELCEDLMSAPPFQDAVTFPELVDETFWAAFVRFFDSDRRELVQSDLADLEGDLAVWVNKHSGDITIYAPCIITEAYSPPHIIGPVRLAHINDFRSELDALEPYGGGEDVLKYMMEGRAYWMAQVALKGRTDKRAWDVGETAVDLALTAIQLVVPLSDGQRMARLHGRVSMPLITRLSTRGDFTSVGYHNRTPGLSIGSGTLESMMLSRAALLVAVKGRISAFVKGCSPTPRLDQAWADAAYWFHEGIAEPLDTIAIPKLETAIEVLLRSEKSSGSQSRLVKAIATFYALDAEQPFSQGSLTTVKEYAKRFVEQRSRILHGTLSTLNSSVGTSRTTIAELAAGLLRAFAWFLDRYQMINQMPADDMLVFLDWVQSQTRPA